MASRKGSKKKDISNKKEHIASSTGMKLIQHKHCAVCGKAQLLEDPEVCSEECQKVLNDNIKRKKMWWIYLAVLAGILFLWFMYQIIR